MFFAVPSYRGIECVHFYKSLEETINLCKNSGWETDLIVLQNCCYIQLVRNELVKQFLDTDCDSLFFLDDDIAWDCKDALKLLEMSDPIVAGVYRKKTEEENYPVVIHTDKDGIPLGREDGCIWAAGIPLGFARIKRHVFEMMIKANPNLKYRKDNTEEIYYDLFPQGISEGRWWGEDLVFCRLWNDLGGYIWVVPDITLKHISKKEVFTGNYHKYLLKLKENEWQQHKQSSMQPVGA